MEITETFYAADRVAWRQWLAEHHATAREIWLVYPDQRSEQPRVPYLDAVEEALCFGWIDGIQKRLDELRTAQRFTPRRPNSNWTELNKARARGLIASGQMTAAGFAKLPNLDQADLTIAEDILQALQADEQTWNNFQQFPELYQRIRIGYIEEMRSQPELFQKRLTKFLQKTHQNKQFGVLR